MTIPPSPKYRDKTMASLPGSHPKESTPSRSRLQRALRHSTTTRLFSQTIQCLPMDLSYPTIASHSPNQTKPTTQPSLSLGRSNPWHQRITIMVLFPNSYPHLNIFSRSRMTQNRQGATCDNRFIYILKLTVRYTLLTHCLPCTV